MNAANNPLLREEGWLDCAPSTGEFPWELRVSDRLFNVEEVLVNSASSRLW
jgi:hypothetical protein